MAFNRDGFIKAAKEQNFSREEINATLKKNGQKPTPPWILDSKALPIGMGALGAIAAGVPTAGAMAIPGGGLSAGAGEVIRRGLIDNLGYQSDQTDTLMNPPKDAGVGLAKLVETPATMAVAAPFISGGFSTLLGALPGIRGPVGKWLESMVNKGQAPNSVIEKNLGNSLTPNPALYERAAVEGQQEPFRDLIRKNIIGLQQGQVGEGGVVNDSIPLSDILKNRTAAYAQSKPAFSIFGNQANPKQNVLANIGKASSNIIHEVIPQSKFLDQIISANKKIYSKTTAAGVGGAALAGLIKYIFGQGAKNIVSGGGE